MLSTVGVPELSVRVRWNVVEVVTETEMVPDSGTVPIP
jgi:hypothetical protein